MSEQGKRIKCLKRLIIKLKRAKRNLLKLRRLWQLEGLGGNKTKEFTFTFEVEGMPNKKFEWTKNGKTQTPIKSGDTFKLSHNDKAIFKVPCDVNVTISENENSEGYTSTFKLGNEPAESVTSKTVLVDADKSLLVTNSRGMVVPAGVRVGVVALIISLIVIIGGIIFFGRRRQEFKTKDI